MELRPYQHEIVDKTIYKLEDLNLVCISAATGAGKSVIISELASRYILNNMSVCIVTNITALIPQLSRHLTEMEIPHNIVKAGMNQYDKDIKVHLLMEQSFHEDKRNELSLDCDVLIKDEYHIGVGQKRFEAIVSHLKPKKVIGLTATPIDELGYLLKGLEPNQIIDDGDAMNLTEQGYLSPLKYFVPKWAENIDYSNVKSSGNDYNGKEIDSIVSGSNHIDNIVESMNYMNAKTKNVLVYASSIENAELIHQALINDGYQSNVIHSKNDEVDNSSGIIRFKSNEAPMCLVSVSSLLIGFDAPNANLLVICRPSKVKRLILQCYGRGTRLFEGKEYCEVLDLAQCVRNHGFLTDKLELIKNGDKKALAKSNNESMLDVSLIAEDEPTEITRDLVLARIEEIKNTTRPQTINELIQIYEQSSTFDIIFKTSVKLYEKVTNTIVEPRTSNWVFNKWDEAFYEYPEYKERWTKAYKSRAKNIIKSCMNGEPKKYASLAYFIDFLIEQKDVPYYG
jgi:superfamily II DNA or RNA helicase